MARSWSERFERGALLLITCLLLVFTLALASDRPGLGIDCGCLGRPLLHRYGFLWCVMFYCSPARFLWRAIDECLLSLLGRN